MAAFSRLNHNTAIKSMNDACGWVFFFSSLNVLVLSAKRISDSATHKFSHNMMLKSLKVLGLGFRVRFGIEFWVRVRFFRL